MIDLINVLFKAFFLTNLWIIIYISLIDYLNFHFPPVLKETFYRNPVAFPEPFEIPIYFIITFVFVALIWLWEKYFSKLRLNLFAKIAILLFLLALFLTKLSSYPFPHDPHPYTLRSDRTIYYLILILYIAFFAIITIQLSYIKHLFKTYNKSYNIIYILVSLLILLITFEPRFPVAEGELPFFLGPVWEILNGKTIYTDIPSQYGFLSILFMSLIAKIKISYLYYLQTFSWILLTIQYFICFYLIYKVSKSLPLSLVGLFSILTLNYLSIGQTIQTSLRWFPNILAIYLIYKSNKIESKKLIFTMVLLSFWFVDSGVAIILTYFMTLGLLTLLQTISFKQAMLTTVYLIASLILIFLFISLIYILIDLKPINIANIFSSMRKHAITGLVMLPMEAKNYFWLFILVYFTSIIYFIRQKMEDTLLVLLFSANLMLFASTYFVGRSHPFNLGPLSIFFLLTVFFLFSFIYNNLSSAKSRILFIITLFIFFTAVPLYKRNEFIAERFISKYEKFKIGNIFAPEIEKIIKDRYIKEVELIRKNLKEDYVVILSTEDTYLLVMSEKKNLLDANPGYGIDSKSDMEFALKTVRKICPKRIAVDCTVYNKCPSHESSSVGFFIAPFILDEIEKGCKLKYMPIACTNKLCISKANI